VPVIYGCDAAVLIAKVCNGCLIERGRWDAVVDRGGKAWKSGGDGWSAFPRLPGAIAGSHSSRSCAMITADSVNYPPACGLACLPPWRSPVALAAVASQFKSRPTPAAHSCHFIHHHDSRLHTRRPSLTTDLVLLTARNLPEITKPSATLIRHHPTFTNYGHRVPSTL
jgi:hypothetical protein